MNNKPIRRFLRYALSASLLLVLITGVVTVRAAFPGTNGKIAFESERDGNTEIYVMNNDGSGQTNLSNNTAIDRDAAWSPDGTKIAFVTYRHGNSEIYTMNADGSGQTRLTNNFSNEEQPAWSPDGTKIAFESERDGNPEIYVMNADGTGQTNLSNNSSLERKPAWSPDGTKIAFETTRDGNFEVYEMNADGSIQTNLTNNPEQDSSANWSPNGTKIVFTSTRDGISYEIYVMNADGSGPTNLSNNPTSLDEQPAWSPDGTKIVFDGNPDGINQIYVMNADGSGPTNLSSNSYFDSNPDWQPKPAVSITVTTTDDDIISNGNCSLREAIQAANTDTAVDACPAGSGADTIILSAGSYVLSISGAGEDGNTTGDLDISDDLTIIGASGLSTIIDGNGIDRVFEVIAGTTVNISNVTVTGGNVIDNDGGGIKNGGTLTITNSSVSGNTAAPNSNRSTDGGGIKNGGAMTITNSTVSSNTATYGGGIKNDGTLTINSSSVNDNTTFGGGDGGGIFSGGTLTMTNSTISHNTATDSGGLLGSATLINVTVAYNIGDDAAGISRANAVTLKNTIIANNFDFYGNSLNCDQPVGISYGHNLDSDGSCFLTGSGDITNSDPLLGLLSDNGGLTKTHALLSGSPAIDAGSPDCPPPATDQRGIIRPQGAFCDIGAFEFIPSFTYNFSGFFQPVDNLPTLNLVKAGQGIPVKFSLNGDQGLNIFAAGYPLSQKIDCDSTAAVDGIEVTLTAGSSSLSYNPSTDTYTYVWKTNKGWVNTCRQLIVKLNDGTYHWANFKFK